MKTQGEGRTAVPGDFDSHPRSWTTSGPSTFHHNDVKMQHIKGRVPVRLVGRTHPRDDGGPSPSLPPKLRRAEQKRATTAFQAQLAQSAARPGQFQAISHGSTTYGGAGASIDRVLTETHPPSWSPDPLRVEARRTIPCRVRWTSRSVAPPRPKVEQPTNSNPSLSPHESAEARGLARIQAFRSTMYTRRPHEAVSSLKKQAPRLQDRCWRWAGCSSSCPCTEDERTK